jgi:Uma2 family endonuclease
MATVELSTEPVASTVDPGPYRAADYMALPDEPRCELIHGRLYVSPSPTPHHQIVSLLLAELFLNAARRTGGKAYVAPLDVHLSDETVVQPDVIYISPQNRGVVQDWIRGAPDIVVEVASPSTFRRDRIHKLPEYTAAGVKEFWIVDPAMETIEFLRLEGGAYRHETFRGSVYRSVQFPEIEIDLTAFWKEVQARK